MDSISEWWNNALHYSIMMHYPLLSFINRFLLLTLSIPIGLYSFLEPSFDHRDPWSAVLSCIYTIVIMVSLMNVLHLLVNRRYKTAADIPESWFKQRKTLKGVVVHVGDADGFRIVHTPINVLGFGASSRQAASTVRRGSLVKESISIRLASIDAPECPNFGKPGQPFGNEAKEWLTQRLLNRKVHVELFKLDQYNRVVAMVYVRSRFNPFRKINVCLEMVEKGYATLYEGRDVDFGGQKELFVKAEQYAKSKRLGLWVDGPNVETPAQYKKKHR